LDSSGINLGLTHFNHSLNALGLGTGD